jgi:hypothetical protein
MSDSPPAVPDSTLDLSILSQTRIGIDLVQAVASPDPA